MNEKYTVDYEAILNVLQGWNAYAIHANTYQLRQQRTQKTINRLEQKTAKRKTAIQHYQNVLTP